MAAFLVIMLLLISGSGLFYAAPSIDNDHVPEGKDESSNNKIKLKRCNQKNQHTNNNIREESLTSNYQLNSTSVQKSLPCNEVIIEEFPARNSTDTIGIWTPQTRRIVSYHNQGSRTLILMRGLPGSGKSFLAKELVKAVCLGAKRNTHIFSTDEFFLPIEHWDITKAQEAHDWNKDRVRNATSRGLSPIFVDNTNVEIWEMEPYVKAGVTNGYIIEVLEANTPWAKNVEQLALKNSHNVSISKIMQMKGLFESVTDGDFLIRKLRLSYIVKCHQ